MNVISFFARFVTDNVQNTTDDMVVSMVRIGFRNTMERRSADGQLIFKCQLFNHAAWTLTSDLFSQFPRVLQCCDGDIWNYYLTIISSNITRALIG